MFKDVITRKVDALGRVVVPQVIRRHLLLEEGDEVTFCYDDETGDVIFQSTKHRCVFCGSTDSETQINGKMYV